MMVRRSSGFTIIEVVLFLGISGFLIVGLMIGTSATISRHRYNDSIQDLAEYFRREYSAVINPENTRNFYLDPESSTCISATSNPVSGTADDPGNPNRGRSACLIYGRLITIGETVDGKDPKNIYSYDVIGRELAVPTASLKTALTDAVITVTLCDSGTNCQPVGSYQYSPQWGARVEVPATLAVSSDLAKASILIVRSPDSGAVHTLVLEGTALPVQSDLATRPSSLVEFVASFTTAELDFCVGSEDILATFARRRDIRLARDGRNSTAVEVVEEDSEDNRC